MNNKNEFFYCTHGLTSGKVKQSINICIHNYIYISVYIYIYIYIYTASLIAQLIKNSPAIQETSVWFLGWEDPLEKGKATHPGIAHT